ncbi:MAG: MFS transporter, partial [FCB group bacterium]|nr:MFS transporter [FCB group bacterium]
MKSKKKFQFGNVLTVSFAHLSHDIYSSFLAPLLPLLISKLDISLSMAGFLDVTRKLPSLFNPLVGLIADRVCVRYFIIITPAITGIAMSLLGVAPSYPILLILLFIAGISNTLFHVPSPVMIKHVSA